MSVRARFGSGRKGARGVRRTILRVRQGWVGLGGSGGMVHREICHRVVASSPLAGGQPRPIQASGDGRSRLNNRNPFSSLSSDQGEGRAKGWGERGGSCVMSHRVIPEKQARRSRRGARRATGQGGGRCRAQKYQAERHSEGDAREDDWTWSRWLVGGGLGVGWLAVRRWGFGCIG